MSFASGIIDTAANAVRGMLGIERPAPEAADADRDSERSGDLARETRTAYDSDSRPGFSLTQTISSAGQLSGADRPSGTTLADKLRARTSTGMTTPDAGEPHAGLDPSMSRRTTSAPSSNARARVLDAATRGSYGTVDNLTGHDDASVAARNVQSGIDYFARTFGRNGIDGSGNGVDVLVNDRSADESGRERFRGNGGYYSMPDGAGGAREAIHFGTGTSYAAAQGLVDQRSMLHADDLAIHEYVHGVIRKETGHLGGHANEAGATNEAIADVMAAAATRDWVIGEGMYTERSAYRNMRNIASPDDPTSIHGLWTSMQQVHAARASGSEVEEHWASGILSTAAYRVQMRLGGEAGWQAVERVFYDSIDHGRLGDMTFGSVARALRTSAATVYGSSSLQYSVFDEELRRAGL